MPSIERNLLEPLREASIGAEVHTLHHLNRQQAVVNPRSNENGTLDEDNYRWFAGREGVVEAPDPSLIATMLPSLLAFGDTYGDGGASLRNLLFQLNSLKQVTRLFLQGGFDAAVFARPDLAYHDALPLNALRFALRQPRACVVPNWQSWGGCNDRFAICGRDAAVAYGNRLDDALAYCKEGPRPLHAEKLLKYTIVRHGLKLRTMPTRASRVRIDGTRKEESFSVYASAPNSRIEKLKLLYLDKLSLLM